MPKVEGTAPSPRLGLVVGAASHVVCDQRAELSALFSELSSLHSWLTFKLLSKRARAARRDAVNAPDPALQMDLPFQRRGL